MSNPESVLQIRKKKAFKRAPYAPKRFNSSYIIFTKEVLFQNANKEKIEGKANDIQALDDPLISNENTSTYKTTISDISDVWKSLTDEMKIPYQNAANIDKLRFFDELHQYNGPLMIPNIRKRRSLDAPKRAVSAFLSFAHSQHAHVRMCHPTETNKDIMKILSQLWQHADKDVKQIHIDHELIERQRYHREMLVWKQFSCENTTVATSKTVIVNQGIAINEIEDKGPDNDIDINLILEANTAMIEANDMQLAQNAFNLYNIDIETSNIICPVVQLQSINTSDVLLADHHYSNPTAYNDMRMNDWHDIDYSVLDTVQACCSPTTYNNNDSIYSDYIHNNLTDFVSFMDDLRNDEQ